MKYTTGDKKPVKSNKNRGGQRKASGIKPGEIVLADKGGVKTRERGNNSYVQQLVPKSISQTRKDIADWKRAMAQSQNAENPRHVLLHELYESVMMDAFLTSQVELRVEKLQSADFRLIDANGKDNDQATARLKSSTAYNSLVEQVVKTKFYRHSLVEFDYSSTGTLVTSLVPRRHVVPERGLFLPDVTRDTGILYRTAAEYGSWIIEIGTSDINDLGLLNKAVPHVLMKKFAQSCWSELCEIYGIPPRVLKTNTRDPEMLDRADEMMRTVGSAAYFIIDEIEEFAFANGVNTNGDVFRNLMATCNQELSLLVLGAVVGQDTVNGNRSKEESSMGLVDAKINADKRHVEFIFNETILPALARIGELPEGLTLKIQKDVNIEQLWKMTNEAALYYDVDTEWIKDTFGIPIIGRRTEAGALGVEGGKRKAESSKLREVDSFFV